VHALRAAKSRCQLALFFFPFILLFLFFPLLTVLDRKVLIVGPSLGDQSEVERDEITLFPFFPFPLSPTPSSQLSRHGKSGSNKLRILSFHYSPLLIPGKPVERHSLVRRAGRGNPAVHDAMKSPPSPLWVGSSVRDAQDLTQDFF